jgi:hypothetical protein
MKKSVTGHIVLSNRDQYYQFNLATPFVQNLIVFII